MTKAELVDEIERLILSGGRRTTAAKVRELLNEFLTSYPNTDDGDVLRITLSGFSASSDTPIVDGDTLIEALQKIQASLNNCYRME